MLKYALTISILLFGFLHGLPVDPTTAAQASDAPPTHKDSGASAAPAADHQNHSLPYAIASQSGPADAPPAHKDGATTATPVVATGSQITTESRPAGADPPVPAKTLKASALTEDRPIQRSRRQIGGTSNKGTKWNNNMQPLRTHQGDSEVAGARSDSTRHTANTGTGHLGNMNTGGMLGSAHGEKTTNAGVVGNPGGFSSPNSASSGTGSGTGSNTGDTARNSNSGLGGAMTGSNKFGPFGHGVGGRSARSVAVNGSVEPSSFKITDESSSSQSSSTEVPVVSSSSHSATFGATPGRHSRQVTTQTLAPPVSTTKKPSVLHQHVSSGRGRRQATTPAGPTQEPFGTEAPRTFQDTQTPAGSMANSPHGAGVKIVKRDAGTTMSPERAAAISHGSGTTKTYNFAEHSAVKRAANDGTTMSPDRAAAISAGSGTTKTYNFAEHSAVKRDTSDGTTMSPDRSAAISHGSGTTKTYNFAEHSAVKRAADDGTTMSPGRAAAISAGSGTTKTYNFAEHSAVKRETNSSERNVSDSVGSEKDVRESGAAAGVSKVKTKRSAVQPPSHEIDEPKADERAIAHGNRDRAEPTAKPAIESTDAPTPAGTSESGSGSTTSAPADDSETTTILDLPPVIVKTDIRAEDAGTTPASGTPRSARSLPENWDIKHGHHPRPAENRSEQDHPEKAHIESRTKRGAPDGSSSFMQSPNPPNSNITSFFPTSNAPETRVRRGISSAPESIIATSPTPDAEKSSHGESVQPGQNQQSFRAPKSKRAVEDGTTTVSSSGTDVTVTVNVDQRTMPSRRKREHGTVEPKTDSVTDGQMARTDMPKPDNIAAPDSRIKVSS